MHRASEAVAGRARRTSNANEDSANFPAEGSSHQQGHKTQPGAAAEKQATVTFGASVPGGRAAGGGKKKEVVFSNQNVGVLGWYVKYFSVRHLAGVRGGR